ncbi:MAG: OmpH family outer membrane protein [Deltaproteobacteria bacterium]|nr:OmpH family outer membrane protein [Deltaproteobacteria bacterium]
MRKLFLMAMTAVVLGGAMPAWATTFAIVDFHKVIGTSKKGRTHRQAIEDEVARRREALLKLQSDLEKDMDEFRQKRLVMTPSQIAEREDQLRAQQRQIERRSADYEEEIKRKDEQLSGEVVSRLRELTEQIAKEKNIDVVFERSSVNVIYAGPALDITDEVLKRFDR